MFLQGNKTKYKTSNSLAWLWIWMSWANRSTFENDPRISFSKNLSGNTFYFFGFLVQGTKRNFLKLRLHLRIRLCSSFAFYILQKEYIFVLFQGQCCWTQPFSFCLIFYMYTQTIRNESLLNIRVAMAIAIYSNAWFKWNFANAIIEWPRFQFLKVFKQR